MGHREMSFLSLKIKSRQVQAIVQKSKYDAEPCTPEIRQSFSCRRVYLLL